MSTWEFSVIVGGAERILRAGGQHVIPWTAETAREHVRQILIREGFPAGTNAKIMRRKGNGPWSTYRAYVVTHDGKVRPTSDV